MPQKTRIPRKLKKHFKKHIVRVFPQLVTAYPDYGKPHKIRVKVLWKDKGTYSVEWHIPNPIAWISAWINPFNTSVYIPSDTMFDKQ